MVPKQSRKPDPSTPPVGRTEGGIERVERASKSGGQEPAHVLIRVKSESGQTFAQHGGIIAAKGTAVLGKIGQPLGQKFINELNDQVSRGLDTYLFLTTREGWNGPYVTYKCRLQHTDTQLPDSQLHLVPKYYSREYPSIKTWFQISTMDKLSRSEMNRIFVLSSGREIMSVVKSSAVVFRVGFRR